MKTPNSETHKRQLLEKRLRDFDNRKPQAITRQAERNLAPLTFAQQRIWFFNQLYPENIAYNRPSNIRLTGTLNVAALKRSLDEIVRRHETLRSTFAVVGESPCQIINPFAPLELPFIDLSCLPAPEARAQQLANEEALRPFDLTRGSLIRATLLKLDEHQHLLFLTIHHIVFDAWSMSVLLRELKLLYEAFVAGNPSPLPELSVQYADYAVWQRDDLHNQKLETQIAYWKQQMADAPALLELPTDYPRQTSRSFRGAHHTLALGDLGERLKSFSCEEGVTIFMTFLAAFYALLYRYTEQDDLVVGAPVAGRTRTEIEPHIGCFINTLVFRTSLAGNPTFRELLQRVRQTALDAYANQDLPFEKLVEELQPERNLSQSPLFQVMVNFRNVPRQIASASNLEFEVAESDTGKILVDLTLEIIEKPEGLSCVFEYNADLFASATIQRMLGHFQKLLEAIVTNPEQLVSELPLLTDAERHQLLFEWNATDAEYPKDLCVHELFEAQATKTPDADAVFLEDTRLTYKELNERANQVAHYLRKRGVKPEILVGLYMERTPEMIVGILGILKAGAAYLPLDAAYPKERVSFILRDAQTPLLLTQRRLAENLSGLEIDVVFLDADWEMLARESEENLSNEATSDNLAYVIYTSGSTGNPKGVMIRHQSLMNFIEDVSRKYEFAAHDRILQFAPISFDTSVLEIFPCLTRGATLMLRNDEMLQSAAAFLRKCEAWDLTVIILPTAYWHEVVASLSAEALTMPPSIRLVGIGGEKALPERFATWRNCVSPAVQLFNGYGPTETTVVVTRCELTQQREADDASHASSRISSTTSRISSNVSIGRPIANTQIYILDSHLQLVPVGVAGELYVGGAGLARGYLNRDELTAERFIPNPFRRTSGERIYKTGDKCRYLPNGEIEFLGRLDNQVKIRGYRVELGEIEAVLARHAGVREGVVLTGEDAPGELRITAYIVSHQGVTPPTISELRGFAKQYLPDYMLPSAFIMLDELPLTPNNKVDRRALSAITQTPPEETFIAPRNYIEKVLAEIWADVLRVERVGVTDNFFELGGHSLLATQVISRIRNMLGVDVPLASLFDEASSVVGMSALITDLLLRKYGLDLSTK